MKMSEDFSKFNVGESKIICGRRGIYLCNGDKGKEKKLQKFRLNEKDQVGTSCWLQTAFRSNNGKLLPEFFTMVQYYVENFNETLKF